MKHIHCGRIPVLHLEGSQVESTVVFVKIKKKLGGLLNRADRFGGVIVSIETEISKGFEVEKIGTGETKKITQHLIGQPDGRQL